MAERAMRAMSADCTTPSANAGSVSDRSVRSQPYSSGEYPATGNHPSCTEKNRMRSRPSRKFGIEMPMSAAAMSA